MSSFINESPIDFSIKAEREKLKAEINKLNIKIKKKKLTAYPVTNGDHVETDERQDRYNPANNSELVSRTFYTPIGMLDNYFERINLYKNEFSKITIKERSNLLLKVADIIAQKRLYFAALCIKEAGKPWIEADAEIIEAIDFCRYYANEILKFESPKTNQDILGESNQTFYFPKGVSVIIPPWNFPFAIPCGMLAASLVTGNISILKPAEQTSYIAYELFNCFLEAGFPKNSLVFAPGKGEIVGDYLVKNHSNIICFTGSKEVGLSILEESSKSNQKNKYIKKVIAEMGGKNTIIVDESADMDAAISGITKSAFAFAGQKCSACSRVIIVGKIYNEFLERLKNATNDLIINNPENSNCFISPVIDKESKARIDTEIEKSKKIAKTLIHNELDYSLKGNFVSPAIFHDVPLDSDLWKNEIFAPVLACISINSFEESIKIANDSEYALTGGIFSRSPENIKFAINNLEVGNLYINRPCTGAIVERQPFGGFKLSGTGPKAGGKDYLLQFLEVKSVTENTMRKGFTPELT
ncbi:UNVERIFIED_CONTAM: hypothetical protein GTU68_029365 [Idotea baltica]|nr:hypothetical protein [Idotea baltica]